MTIRRVPWLALSLPLLALAVWGGGWAMRTFSLHLPPCPLKAHTGIPCATCGITRCLLALTDGRLAEAFHWHPVAVILIFLVPGVALWDLLRAWRGKPYPPLPESLWARLGVIGLLLGTWILQIVRGI